MPAQLRRCVSSTCAPSSPASSKLAKFKSPITFYAIFLKFALYGACTVCKYGRAWTSVNVAVSCIYSYTVFSKTQV